MSLVSYAQNFEDVMLWRALKHIYEGFYIDVGANDPSIDSVTRLFYEHGWHGINIEPLPKHAADLRAQRVRDINIQCAAGAETGELELWECDVRGWATALPETVAQHAASGHIGVFHKVSVRRLAEICEEFVSSDIHFLKVDVEGFEASVLRGMDFSKFRPWILVVEATKPNSTTEAYDEWEGIVLGADYRLAYCDGLNRFYVASEHPELLESLRYPPNVFDSFIRSEQLSSELRAQQAESKAQQAESKAQQAEAKAQQAATHAATAEAESRASVAQMQNLLNSKSWRMTAPLRSASSALRGVTLKILKPRAKGFFRYAARYVGRRPRLKRLALKILNCFPRLKARLHQINTGIKTQTHHQHPGTPTEVAHLNPRARQIYADLKAAALRRQKENG